MLDSGNSVDSQKRAIRSVVRNRRRALSTAERQRNRASITAHLRQLVQDFSAASVTCFLSLPDEPDTSEFLAWAREQNLRVLLPRTRDDGLLDWTVFSGAPPEIGVLGIPEAPGERLPPEVLNTVDLALIPACAVDTRGIRLGWGRGFFDKTLDSLNTQPPLFALVFDEDIFPALPNSAHDYPVDGAVTPGGVIRFR